MRVIAVIWSRLNTPCTRHFGETLGKLVRFAPLSRQRTIQFADRFRVCFRLAKESFKERLL
jgi:hypothetical protein